ncbi:MAG: phenylacetate--CoA ligase family protein [Intrasporangium sp.]|uniref:phenylacetate--CoA ligase family protein n=1 Tax=Intrasporangium sp. TaxID=1925024 RepID=UPI0026478646|nr:phenylacetate--CoA ligase family protein [Intrasporangium sp.]MDN5796782.1 phenylacetate--CoA ligase family protein [Intrasporangium sp.]
MDLQLLLRVLRLRRQLARQETWSWPRLQAHQDRALRALRVHAYAASPFYRRFHEGLFDAPLSALPVLTKAQLMENFDEVVTDRDIRLAQVRSFLEQMRGAERLKGRYYVAATAGTTGRPGIFLWDVDEWAGILASYSRPYAWGGAALRLTKRTKMAVVSSTTPWHQSALVGATVDSPFIPTLRLDSSDPMEDLVARLDTFEPDVLVGYASMLRLLAVEAMERRLHIKPKAIFSASEVLTDESRRRIGAAWGRKPMNVYAATETAGIAAECEHHTGLHLFEDLVITEVVDGSYRPVPVGEFGSKVLVTVLGSRTMPLIRYELSDSVRLAPAEPCPCGRAFARIDSLQGREEDSLALAKVDGGRITVQPGIFHRVMDLVPVVEWQVVHDDRGLTILVAGQESGFQSEDLRNRLHEELVRTGAVVPVIRVESVEKIPRTPLGKAPLIRSIADHTGN